MCLLSRGLSFSLLCVMLDLPQAGLTTPHVSFLLPKTCTIVWKCDSQWITWRCLDFYLFPSAEGWDLFIFLHVLSLVHGTESTSLALLTRTCMSLEMAAGYPLLSHLPPGTPVLMFPMAAFLHCFSEGHAVYVVCLLAVARGLKKRLCFERSF